MGNPATKLQALPTTYWDAEQNCTMRFYRSSTTGTLYAHPDGLHERQKTLVLEMEVAARLHDRARFFRAWHEFHQTNTPPEETKEQEVCENQS